MRYLNYPRNRYVPGAYRTTCDRCGFPAVNTDLVREAATRYRVHPECADASKRRKKLGKPLFIKRV